MFKIGVLLAAFVVATTVAYDFSDSAFNEYLMDHMRDIRESLYEPAITRFRRDTENDLDECKVKLINKIKCCKDKFDPKLFEPIKAIKKQCYKELYENDEFSFDAFTCEKMEELKSRIFCTGECVAKKLNFLGDDNEVKKDVLLQTIKTKYTDDEDKWKVDEAEAIVDHCIEYTKKAVAEIGETKCSPVPIKMAFCMWKGYIKACPKDLQVDSDRCNKLRERLANGGSILGEGILTFAHELS